MYHEIPTIAFTIDSIKPTASMGLVKDYQPIPDSILLNYPTNVDVEHRVLIDFEKYNQEMTRLEKARIVRKNRKAPGLQDTILVPTKVVELDKKRQSPVKENKVDYSEFDMLQGNSQSLADEKMEMLILGQVMSSSSISDPSITTTITPKPVEFIEDSTKPTLLENVRFIAEMGFTEEQATMALLKMGNDRNRALEHLLNA